MKKWVTLLIFFLLVYDAAFAQDYIPFPSDSAYWKVRQDINYPSSSSGEWISEFFLDDDTAINAKTYHKIYKDYQSISFYPTADTTIGQRQYFGCIREEDKIVFLIPADSISEHELFDFNLNVGDTLYMNDLPLIPVKVLSIDSLVTFDGVPHKRFNITSCSFCTEWYAEGIGANTGFTFWNGFMAPFWGSVGLRCFSVAGEEMYNQGNINDCASLNLSTGAPASDLNLFSVYPTIILQNASFVIDAPTNRSYKILIYNIDGHIEFASDASGPMHLSLATDLQIGPGIHLIVIDDFDRREIKKIVVY